MIAKTNQEIIITNILVGKINQSPWFTHDCYNQSKTLFEKLLNKN